MPDSSEKVVGRYLAGRNRRIRDPDICQPDIWQISIWQMPDIWHILPFLVLDPVSSRPALAKMVKQYFAAPASSAGVERVFSAAGKMHGDLQKSAKDSTLEHSLFAAFIQHRLRTERVSGGPARAGGRGVPGLAVIWLLSGLGAVLSRNQIVVSTSESAR